MSTTANEIWLGNERIDLDDETQLLPSFQANDRTKPDTIQSDYSPEFSVPDTAHNHRLLKYAAASQPAQGQAYVRVPAVLTSGGVETLPLALLYIKGYKEGRYLLQLFGGNKRLVEALGDKKLADLDLNRFNHYWTAAEVLAGLPYAHWQSKGWGYEVYERGKPLDLQNLDPFTLYPSVAAWLVWQQILADAGFTADSLLGEAFFAALNVPAANPYEFSQKFRDARQLTAGYVYAGSDTTPQYYRHTGGFSQERLQFAYTERKPYHLPEATTGATYFGGRYTADTLGFYDIEASIPTRFGCNDRGFGKVRVKFMLLVNGQHLFDDKGAELGKDEQEQKEYITKTFNPKLSRYLLHAGDTVELVWQGDEIGGAGGINPSDPLWAIGPHGALVPLGNNQFLSAEVKFTCTLLPDFPPGGLVRLQDWLPEMTQLAFVKSQMVLGGLTIQADAYEPHLHLATGDKLLANTPKAKDWTAKRDAYAQPGRLPERDLSFRFGSYAQKNVLKWTEDENVLLGYGDGTIAMADEVLPNEYELATLPFAATQDSPDVGGLLRILNFEAQDLTVDPITYSSVTAKPRLTLRRADAEIAGKLITTPATTNAQAVLTDFATTVSYFASAGLSLLLDGTVLTTYWADLRAMLDQSRYLVERYRLTPRDISELDYSVPIWDAVLGDYFCVSAVGEYDARRSVEVRLARINAAYLPAPVVPGAGVEFWEGEFYSAEYY
jgi:hypothetical protein